MKLKERDTMPAEAVREALANDNPGNPMRLNRAQRNRLRMELAKVYVPDVVLTEEELQDAVEEKLLRKLGKATWAQLVKWTRRATARRALLQKRNAKLAEERFNQEQALEKAQEQGWVMQISLCQQRLKLLAIADAHISTRAMFLDEFLSAAEQVKKARGIKANEKPLAGPDPPDSLAHFFTKTGLLGAAEQVQKARVK